MFLMLARLEIVSDEPAERYDERDIERKAVRFWHLLRYELADRYGRARPEVRRLTDPRAEGHPDGRLRDAGGPSISEFHGFDPLTGAWFAVGSGARGEGPVSVVQYLAGPGCERRKAAEFLRSLVDRVAVYERVS
jgi:hypothetical protein